MKREPLSQVQRAHIFRFVLDRPQCEVAERIEMLVIACQQAIYALKGREHDGFLRDAIAKATGAAP